MLIGLLSDTHGHLPMTRRAVEFLTSVGATQLLHAGDIGLTAVIDLLAGTNASFVFGNNDWDQADLRRTADAVGVTCLGMCGTVEIAGKRIALTHGDDGTLVRRLLDAQQHDYLVTGHTHVRHDQTVGRTRTINPGALYRAAVKTVATLDLSSNLLTFHVVG